MADVTATFNSVALGDGISADAGYPDILPAWSHILQIDPIFRQSDKLIRDQKSAIYSVTLKIVKDPKISPTYDTFMKRLNYFDSLRAALGTAKATLTITDGTTSFTKTDAYLESMAVARNDKRGIYISLTFKFTNRT